jgi:hypothetical protein
MNVAVPEAKHSPLLGHFAPTHTVFKPSPESTSSTGPVPQRTGRSIHLGILPARAAT